MIHRCQTTTACLYVPVNTQLFFISKVNNIPQRYYFLYHIHKLSVKEIQVMSNKTRIQRHIDLGTEVGNQYLCIFKLSREVLINHTFSFDQKVTVTSIPIQYVFRAKSFHINSS